MNELLMQTIVDKLNSMEDGIKRLKEQMPTVPDYSAQLAGINQSLIQAQESITRLPQQLKFPAGAVHTLTQQLDVNNDLLSRPPRQEVRHHHHVTTGLIISGILVLLLTISVCWIYNLYDRKDNYKANDIKYRYLKLQESKPLQVLLYETDSLYRKRGKAITDSVIQEEEARELRKELQEKAERKEQEAQQLREQARQQ